MRRSTRKIVPVWSDESMDNASPATPTFIRVMREYERRKTLNLPNFSYSPNSYESDGSISSETSYEYNQRIKRKNSCIKCCSVLSILACFIGISTA